MPIVTIQVTREGTKPGVNAVTAEEKAALIKGVSELLRDVLNKPLDATFVVIEEVVMDNWGWGGLPVAEFRRVKGPRTDQQRPPRGGGNTHRTPGRQAEGRELPYVHV